MMRVLWNIEERMEQIIGQPSRMLPLADDEIREPALGAIERMRQMLSLIHI